MPRAAFQGWNGTVGAVHVNMVIFPIYFHHVPDVIHLVAAYQYAGNAQAGKQCTIGQGGAAANRTAFHA